MENSKSKGILYTIGRLLYYVVIAFICLIALFLLYYIVSSQMNANNEDYRPKLSIYTIVSPSMTPTIKVYDVVINVREDKPENIKVGDIITYVSKASTSEGMTITHRVVEVIRLPDGNYEYKTQGDNNSEPDSLYVEYDQVIGKEKLIIPYLGRIQFLIANQKGWLFLLLIPVSIYTFIEIYKLIGLFSIKNRVKEVVNNHEREDLDRQQEELENARKEKIKEELKVKNSNLNPVPLPTTREEIAQYKENAVEVLDTDPLTTRIKEYDDRIEQLDRVLNRMEKELPDEEIDKEPVEENYLKGDKIKVVTMETAKKGKNRINPTERKRNNQIIDLEFEEKTGNNDLEDIIPLENDRSIIERPHSSDIVMDLEEKKEKTKSNNKNKSLNLNPRNVKKVRRPSRNNNNNRRGGNRNLNLNPSRVKRVTRNRPKPKKKLIVIEKQK